MWIGLVLLLKGLADIAEENNHDKHEGTSSTSMLYGYLFPHTPPINGHK